jgi:uncharacterized protein YjgD (DUF1641 family)
MGMQTGANAMAKPLPIVLKPPQISNENDVRADLQRKLAEAPIEHAAAVLSLYELVQKLHDSGSLDLLRGFFGVGDQIIGKLSSALASPESVRTIRNLIVLSQIIASIDPRVFENMRDAISETAEKGVAMDEKPPGLWSIVKRADSENSLRALSLISIFLDSLGKRLKPMPDDDANHSPRD